MMTARRLSTYLAFMTDFLRKSLRVTRHSEKEVPENFRLACRPRRTLLTQRRSSLVGGPGRGAPPLPIPPKTGARHPHPETSCARRPTPSHHLYQPDQSPAPVAP